MVSHTVLGQAALYIYPSSLFGSFPSPTPKQIIRSSLVPILMKPQLIPSYLSSMYLKYICVCIQCSSFKPVILASPTNLTSLKYKQNKKTKPDPEYQSNDKK